MVSHIIFHTDFGDAAVIYRENRFSIIKILLPSSNRKYLFELIAKNRWGKPGFHQKAKMVSDLIIDYFNGRDLLIPLEWLDMDRLTKLQKSVLIATADIQYGKLSTYKKIAASVGFPKAYRFVGNTLANNPYPILIPCHRVIRSNSSIGGFTGGTELKKKLIALEAKFTET